MHIFSTLFIAQTVDGELRTEEGLRKAAEWCRASGLHKVYIESFRDGLFVDRGQLVRVRDYFLEKGFDACGCVTTSQLPARSNNWKDACCYTAPETREKLREIFERTSSVFDVIMVDDFLFTDCTCPLCDAARGERSFDEYHCDVMHEVSEEYILKPAHRTNPKCRVIIKYPLWYEDYRKNGYDTVRQTLSFDGIWAGTETREPDAAAWGRFPQTNAFFVMAWANKLGKGRCGGGWYDPYSTEPATYLDQARQTVLAQARESMLYSYDTLSVHIGSPDRTGEEYAPGTEDTDALRREMPALRKLAYLTETKHITGVSVPKLPNSDAKRERFLPSFYGMAGIPVSPDVRLDPKAPSVILGSQAAGYPGVRDYALRRIADGMTTAVTKGFADQLGFSEGILIDITKDRGDAPDFDPYDGWNITKLPGNELQEMRDALTGPLGLFFRAPSGVGLNLYDDDMEVIQNFRNEEVTVTIDLFGRNRKARKIVLSLPEDRIAKMTVSGTVYTLRIPARTYAVLG